MAAVRPAAVAGAFYPSDPKDLADTVDAMLAKAPSADNARVVAAPHAGYVYSGQIAAHAYNALPKNTSTVLLLGPTHRVGIEGMALTGADFQRTPLGDIETDRQLTEVLLQHPDVFEAPVVHAQEHSLEVHLPFLQRRLHHPFTVVPVAVGLASPASVAEVIGLVLERPNTAVVISSDLSHFLSAQAAEQVDLATLRDIQTGELVTPDQACGAHPLNGMIDYAARNEWSAQVLAAGNSSATSGDSTRVVGYASLAWYPDADEGVPSQGDVSRAGAPQASATEGGSETAAAPARPSDFGPALIWLAQAALARKLGLPQPLEPDVSPAVQDFLDEDGACFVTLEKSGRLRGCIGSLVPQRPLREDVAENAVAAGFRDPRFSPLTPEEFKDLTVEVSVLGQPKPLKFTDQQDVISRLRPGADGVILSWGPHRATFLPQVWDQLPVPEEFLAALKQKAGLPPDFWAADLKIDTYPVTSYMASAGDASSGDASPSGASPGTSSDQPNSLDSPSTTSEGT